MRFAAFLETDKSTRFVNFPYDAEPAVRHGIQLHETMAFPNSPDSAGASEPMHKGRPIMAFARKL